MTEKVVWHVVKTHAKNLDMPKLAPHDLRRSCARFCHAAGGELEQIQFSGISTIRPLMSLVDPLLQRLRLYVTPIPELKPRSVLAG